MLINKFHWISQISKKVVFHMEFIENIITKPLNYYDIEMPAAVQRSINKRKYEFLAGQICAIEVCRQLQRKITNISRDEIGRPLWPNKIVGSITHTDKIAIAAAGFSYQFQSIGIDSEQLNCSCSIISAIQSLALCQDEIELAKNDEDFILMFSAKEALYKCLSPINYDILDYKDAKVITIDRYKNIVCLKSKYWDLFYAHFSFDYVNQHVHTFVNL